MQGLSWSHNPYGKSTNKTYHGSFALEKKIQLVHEPRPRLCPPRTEMFSGQWPKRVSNHHVLAFLLKIGINVARVEAIRNRGGARERTGAFFIFCRTPQAASELLSLDHLFTCDGTTVNVYNPNSTSTPPRLITFEYATGTCHRKPPCGGDNFAPFLDTHSFLRFSLNCYFKFYNITTNNTPLIPLQFSGCYNLHGTHSPPPLRQVQTFAGSCSFTTSRAFATSRFATSHFTISRFGNSRFATTRNNALLELLIPFQLSGCYSLHETHSPPPFRHVQTFSDSRSFATSRFTASRFATSRFGTSRFRAFRFTTSRFGTSRFRAFRFTTSRFGTSRFRASRFPASRFGTSRFATTRNNALLGVLIPFQLSGCYSLHETHSPPPFRHVQTFSGSRSFATSRFTASRFPASRFGISRFATTRSNTLLELFIPLQFSGCFLRLFDTYRHFHLLQLLLHVLGIAHHSILPNICASRFADEDSVVL